MKALLKKLITTIPIPLTKNHKYDLQTKKIIKQLDKTANTIDIGCHKGEIMDLLLGAAPNGIHFGLEPIDQFYQNLLKKYSRRDNCHILDVAASNVKGTSTFNHVISNPAYSGLKKRDYDRPNENDVTITVKTDLLDNIIPQDLPIHFIKIDVEGAELMVLEGATKLLKKYRPIVVFEHGLGAADHYNARPEALYDLFDSCGMGVNLLGRYLKRDSLLSRSGFADEFDSRRNYYFVACNKN